MYSYFSTGNGQPREPALCQLYRHTIVPYTLTGLNCCRLVVFENIFHDCTTAVSHLVSHVKYLLLLLLLKSVELDDDVELLLSVACLVMGPRVTSESEIGRTDSAALRTSRACLRLCGSCVTSCTSFFRASDPAIYEAPETSQLITDSSPCIPVACQSLQVAWLNVAVEEICFDVVDEAFLWTTNGILQSTVLNFTFLV